MDRYIQFQRDVNAIITKDWCFKGAGIAVQSGTGGSFYIRAVSRTFPKAEGPWMWAQHRGIVCTTVRVPASASGVLVDVDIEFTPGRQFRIDMILPNARSTWDKVSPSDVSEYLLRKTSTTIGQLLKYFPALRPPPEDPEFLVWWSEYILRTSQ